MKKTLIIDCHNVGYSSFYTFGELSYQEKKTGVIFGFLRQIFNLAKKFETNKFIFCWDSRKSYRKLIYPEYKESRYNKELTKEELRDLKLAREQFTTLRKDILPRMGFNNNFMQVGYEADDLMAKLALDINNVHWTTLVTSDKDLYQMLYECSIYNLSTKKEIDWKWFTDKYGIVCYEWSDVKAIGGCDSDGVKGIKGAADPTKSESSKALSYFKQELTSGVIFDKIQSKEGKRIIKRNKRLIKLPFEGKIPIKLELQEDNFNKNSFIDVFVDYDMQSFLKKEALDEWIKLFDL